MNPPAIAWAAIDAALNGKAEVLAKPVDSKLLLDTVAAA